MIDRIGEYSPVRHLASAIFPFSYKYKLMLMLSAYMDETGHPHDLNSRFVGMAGLLAPSLNWERFESQWNDTLNRFNLDYFHMKDFAHSKKAFKNWKGDEERRRALLGDLVQVIRQSHAVPFGGIIPMEPYRSFPKHLQETLRSPYHLSFTVCCYLLFALARPARPLKESIAPVFAEHAEFQHQAAWGIDFLRNIDPEINELLDSPVFRSPQKIVALQAADFVAYEMQKEAVRRRYSPSGPIRWGWTQIDSIVREVAPASRLFVFNDDKDVSKYMELANQTLLKSIVGRPKTTSVRLGKPKLAGPYGVRVPLEALDGKPKYWIMRWTREFNK